MDHLHYTGDHTKTRTHSVIGSTNKPRRKISFEVSEDARRGSAWSSDTRLNKPDSDWEARARANTTGNDPEDVPVDKTERKRKRSFPLSFLFKLADSRKNSSGSLGSSKTVKARDTNEAEQDSTPEYVPLRRATTVGPLANKRPADNKINERRRKKSAPLSFAWNQYENDMVKNNSMDSLPTKLDSPATRHKASRYSTNGGDIILKIVKKKAKEKYHCSMVILKLRTWTDPVNYFMSDSNAVYGGTVICMHYSNMSPKVLCLY
jgi:hypothetical protein